jgi:hypothetical protein
LIIIVNVSPAGSGWHKKAIHTDPTTATIPATPLRLPHKFVSSPHETEAQRTIQIAGGEIASVHSWSGCSSFPPQAGIDWL